MAGRLTWRPPLMLEQLEPRLYLNGTGTGSGHDALAGLRLLAQSLLVARLDAADVQSFALDNAQTSVIVIDLGGGTTSGDAAVGQFDGATGALLDSAPVTGGQIVLVTGVPPGGSSGGTGRLTVDELARLLDSGPVSPPGRPVTNEAAPPARPPVLVLFPTGQVPDSFPIPPVTPPAVSGDTPPRDPAAPVVLSPLFSRWFYGLNTSSWWTRTMQRPDVQSRLDDIWNRGIEGDLVRGDTTMPGNIEPDDLLEQNADRGSRVLMRSPVRLMAFTTCSLGGHDRPGASELATYHFSTGQLTRTGHMVAGGLVATRGQVAFLTSEMEQGTDLNGDGRLGATVLQLFNPVTGGVQNTGIRAEAVRGQAGQVVVGVRESPAAAAGLMAYRFDPTTGRLINMRAAYHADAQAAVDSTDQWSVSSTAGRFTGNQSPVVREFPRLIDVAPIDSGSSRVGRLPVEAGVRLDLGAMAGVSRAPAGPPDSGESRPSSAAGAPTSSDAAASGAGGSE